MSEEVKGFDYPDVQTLDLSCIEGRKTSTQKQLLILASSPFRVKIKPGSYEILEEFTNGIPRLKIRHPQTIKNIYSTSYLTLIPLVDIKHIRLVKVK